MDETQTEPSREQILEAAAAVAERLGLPASAVQQIARQLELETHVEGISQIGESAMPRPITFGLAAVAPADYAAAGIPPGTDIWAAEVADGKLQVMAYQLSNGAETLWMLEVAHVSKLLGDDGNPKAGRCPHLWEVRAAAHRFIPNTAIMAINLLPPDLPAVRPPNCVFVQQVGKVERKDRGGLILM